MMYEWEKEQTATSNTISVLLLRFVKPKIAVDSAASGGKVDFSNSVSVRRYFAIQGGTFSVQILQTAIEISGIHLFTSLMSLVNSVSVKNSMLIQDLEDIIVS